MKFRTFINKLFTKHLMVTNCVGVCGSLAIGDFCEQKIAARVRATDESTNMARIGRMSASGVPVAVVDTVWYKWLDGRFLGASTKVALKKLALDMAVAGPVINMIWLSTIELLEGRSFSNAIRNSLDKLPIIILGEICFYMPAQFINFKYVPGKFRVVYLAVLSTIWVVFLSYVQHDLKDHKVLHRFKKKHDDDSS